MEHSAAMLFTRSTTIHAPADVVFAFHERPDALRMLLPPWQNAEVLKPPKSLAVGTEVILRVRIGPFWKTIVAEHVAYEKGRMFADRMLKGPFKSWLHRHLIVPTSASECTLTDDIDYELPLGALGRLFGTTIARNELDRLFDFRHTVTRRACEQA